MSVTARPAEPGLRRDAVANRRRILSAARAAFARDGIDVSLIEIARRAGVGNATLHRNFTRESLVEALYQEWRDRRRAAVGRALADPDPWRGLTAFMADMLADSSRERTLLDLYMVRLHREVRGANPFAELIRRVKESGRLRPDASREDLFLVLWGISRTLSITGDAPGDQLHRHVAIALDGLRARPGQAPLPGRTLSNRELDRLIGDWAQTALARRRG